MMDLGDAQFALVSEQFRMDIVALIPGRFVHLHRAAMRVGPGVLADARHLPGNLHARLAGLNGEAAIGDFRRDDGVYALGGTGTGENDIGGPGVSAYGGPGTGSTTVGGNGVNASGANGGNAGGAGVVAIGGNGPYGGAGILALAGTGLEAYAGTFVGDVDVTGTLSKPGGSFKIDHPLDPANKYLYHSFVESPDMMNIYNGNVVTDGSGAAIVTMPSWFEALNTDFRYQLTVIGQFAQAIVAAEIANRSFIIKTSKPG